MIDNDDVRKMVALVMDAQGNLSTSVDLYGLVTELLAKYPLIGEPPDMTVDAIPDDEFWAAVARHHLTQTEQ